MIQQEGEIVAPLLRELCCCDKFLLEFFRLRRRALHVLERFLRQLVVAAAHRLLAFDERDAVFESRHELPFYLTFVMLFEANLIDQV